MRQYNAWFHRDDMPDTGSPLYIKQLCEKTYNQVVQQCRCVLRQYYQATHPSWWRRLLLLESVPDVLTNTRTELRISGRYTREIVDYIMLYKAGLPGLPTVTAVYDSRYIAVLQCEWNMAEPDFMKELGGVKA